MMLKKIIFAVFICVSATPVFAGVDVLSKLGAWGGGGVTMSSNSGNYCIANNEQMCVGTSLTNHKCKTDDNKQNRTNTEKNLGTLAWVVRGGFDKNNNNYSWGGIQNNGVYICVTQVQAAVTSNNVKIQYGRADSGAQGCRWLCRDGYTGWGCWTKETGATCDKTPVKQTNFNGYALAQTFVDVENKASTDDAATTETGVPMFYNERLATCSCPGIKEEHNMILAATEWAPGGHGAFVQPVVVRASCISGGASGIALKPVGTKTLLCAHGYNPNAAGTDCIAVNETTCKKSNMCSGWPADGFKEARHSLYYNVDKDCYEWRCANPGAAFPSAADRDKCETCKLTARTGAPDSTGVCVKCPVGKLYTDTPTATGEYCRDAKPYSALEMQYGPNKNQNTAFKNQCWSKTNPTDFEKCIKGK